MPSPLKRHRPDPDGDRVQSDVFLRHVTDSDTAVAALAFFRKSMDVPGEFPTPVFFARLYETMLNHMLLWIDTELEGFVVESPVGNAFADRGTVPTDVILSRQRLFRWRALYRLDREVDPHYFSRAQVLGAIQAGPELPEPFPQMIFDILSGFFRLRREGFLDSYPSQVVSKEDLANWVRIFPAEFAWNSINILSELRLLGIGSRMGVRGYRRFYEGRFTPEYNYSEWLFWQSQIETWCEGGANVQGDPVAPQELGFLCNVHAGRAIGLGFYGPCGKVPECTKCALEPQCIWSQHPVGDSSTSDEALGMVRRGRQSELSNPQILQALFNIPKTSMRKIEEQVGSMPLRELAEQGDSELEALLDRGPLGYERLVLLFEICKRFNDERLHPGQLFRTPWDIFRHFRIRMRDLKQEQFIVVMLDRKRQYLKDILVSQGTLDASPVHPREVFKSAIRESAASIVIVHNHPSGDPTPSEQDLQVTRHLCEVGKMVGIPVMDHVIIADERYLSLAVEGQLEP